MPTVRLSKRARRWLSRKIAELSDVNPAAAMTLAKRFERQKVLLATFPKMTEKGVIAGMRKVSMPPLILTVREHDGVVTILAIRDGRQKDALAPSELQAQTRTGDKS